MKSNFVKVVFTVIALTVASALEELLPHPEGVGFPLLLALALFAAERWSIFAMVLVAVATGGSEDALSHLPYFASIIYYLLIGVAVRWSHSPTTLAIAAYPVYQLWLGLWGVNGLVATMPRFLWAIPIGAITVFAASMSLNYLTERAGIE